MINKNLKIVQFTAFIKKEKFSEGKLGYPGQPNTEIRKLLNELMNLAAKDFMEVMVHNPSREDFLKEIDIALDRFDQHKGKIDSEDEDQICHLFEELMDIVGLSDSGGKLMKWRYGLDIDL